MSYMAVMAFISHLRICSSCGGHMTAEDSEGVEICGGREFLCKQTSSNSAIEINDTPVGPYMLNSHEKSSKSLGLIPIS